MRFMLVIGGALVAALLLPVGARVEWKQRDDVGHTVTADDGSFDSGALGDR